MTSKPEKNLPFTYENATDKLVELVSDTNRSFVQVGVEQRRNEQLKPRSIYSWTLATHRLDVVVGGKPFLSLVKADYVATLETWRGALSARSLFQFSIHLKVTYKDAHNVDHLPRDIRKALAVKLPKESETGRTISPEEFEGLLRAASQLRGGSNGVPTSTLWTALLWTLLDAGLRASELLGLRIGDVEDRGEQYLLHLRADGRVLKTGPRVVPVVLAVPALRALLSVHPHRDGKLSFLFLNQRKRGDSGAMRYLSLNRTLTRLANVSGVNAGRPLTENVTPHDFRHTCATNKARDDWQPIDMMKFFGWTTLKMALTYVHRNYEDIAQRAARDAGLVAGVPQPVVRPVMAVGGMVALADVQKLVDQAVTKALAEALRHGTTIETTAVSASQRTAFPTTGAAAAPILETAQLVSTA